MSILKDLVELTENIESLSGIHEALKSLVDADGALETSAAASQLVAELAITIAVTATVRTAMSSLRLGLALTDQIWKWEAVSWAAGVSSSLTAGAIIDWVNEQDIGGSIYDWTHPNELLISEIQVLHRTAETTTSPLILDLDGDGVETISKTAGIHFDHDGNGFAETTGWVGKDDGLLVWDRNGNGLIDDGSELFGNNTKLANGQNAANGFAALAELDSNQDGKIDASDAAFNQLLIWKDADSDAVLEAGELQGLSEANVGSLDTDYANQDLTDAQGNKVLQAGTYTDASGVVRSMNDIWFAVDTARTKNLNLDEVSAEIAALPEVAGFGNVASLRQAMACDASDQLKTLVSQFATETDATKRQVLLDQIIFKWSGADQYSATSRGMYISDGRKLYALEAFLGESFIQGGGTNEGTPDPGPAAALELLSAYDKLANYVDAHLLAASHLKPFYDSIRLAWDTSKQSFALNVDTLVEWFSENYAEHHATDLAAAFSLMQEFGRNLKEMGEFGSLIQNALAAEGSLTGDDFAFALTTVGLGVLIGSSGNNHLLGDAENNLIVGGESNESLYGGQGHDRLRGSEGADILYGGEGNDTLEGGSGSDYLSGDAGSDIYRFSRGWGQDNIDGSYNEPESFDVIEFAAEIAPGDIGLTRAGPELIVSLVGTTDQITVWSYFDADGISPSTLAEFRFANGMIWTQEQVKAMLLLSTDGNDVLYGFSSNDTINGGLGDDHLFGELGDDTLNGQEGSDFIYAGEGNDLLSGGDGSDYLLGENGNDVLDGGADGDYLSGGDGADILEGGTGDDGLTGDAGSDIYRFSRGWGRDSISNYDDGIGVIDAIEFSADIAPDDITVSRSNTDLILKLQNSEDQITLSYYFEADGSSPYALEEIRFANGTVWTVAQVKEMALQGTDGDDRLYSYAAGSTLNGGLGSDVLYGNVGNDTLLGGDGSDYLYGDTGNDLLDGGLGADVMYGGAGDDIYVVDNDTDYVAENPGEGVDTVKSYVSFTLDANTEHLTLLGTNAINATGNAASNNLYGNLGDNVLQGGGGNDTLTGDAGNDRLDGGAGNDSMLGGVGNDTYVVGSTSDAVTENANEGSDTIEASITLTLGNNVENLTLTGSAALNGTGNALNNILTGNSGKNTLTGGAGNDRLDGKGGIDTLLGGAGDDTYVVDLTTDVITENAGEGNDTVESSVTLTLGNNLENLTLTGTAALNGTGNALDNILIGNSGKNTLTGGAGNDRLDGKAGVDTLTGGVGNDTYVLGRGYGADTVVESDATAGNTDVAQFLSGIATDQLWFTKALGTNNLEVSVIGTSDKLIIKDWYVGTANHVEQFKTSDGKTLLDSQVQNLVNAMSAFAPPAAGQTSLPSNYHAALDSVIAANWQ